MHGKTYIIYCMHMHTSGIQKLFVHIAQIQIHHCQLTALSSVILSSVSVPATQDSLNQTHSLNVSFYKNISLEG